MLAVIVVANPFLEAAQGNSFICRFMSLRQFYDCRAIKKREKDQRKEEEEKKKVFLEVDSSPRLCGGVIDKSLFFFSFRKANSNHDRFVISSLKWYEIDEQFYQVYLLFQDP